MSFITESTPISLQHLVQKFRKWLSSDFTIILNKFDDKEQKYGGNLISNIFNL